jgi:hypothetical protein
MFFGALFSLCGFRPCSDQKTSGFWPCRSKAHGLKLMPLLFFF